MCYLWLQDTQMILFLHASYMFELIYEEKNKSDS